MRDTAAKVTEVMWDSRYVTAGFAGLANGTAVSLGGRENVLLGSLPLGQINWDQPFTGS